MADSNYLDFLSGQSQIYYFGIPKFGDEQRRAYFDLSPEEKDYYQELNTDLSRIAYILISGYFKYSSIFHDVSRVGAFSGDTDFICKRFHLRLKVNQTVSGVARSTVNRHIEALCKSFGFVNYKASNNRKQTLELASKLSKLHNKPVFIFTELMNQLSKEKIALPSYREFQILISISIRQEERRLAQYLKTIPSDIAAAIEKLLVRSKFSLTNIITLPKSVSNKEIKLEIERLIGVKPLYLYACELLSRLEISPESIKYYSSLVKYYGRPKLHRMSTPMVKLYVLCHIHHRCQRIYDNLVEIFQALVSRYHTEMVGDANEALVNFKSSFEKEEENLAVILDFYTTSSRDKKSFKQVRCEAYQHVTKKQISQATSYMRSKRSVFNKMVWKLLGEAQPRFKKNLRRIFLQLGLTIEDKNLREAYNFLKSQLLSKGSYPSKLIDCPLSFIPNKLKDFVLDDEQPNSIDFGTYEFLVYYQINEHLTASDASISDSINFKNLTEDLLSDEEAARKNFTKIGMPILDSSIESHLNELENSFAEKLEEVNQNIALGINQEINIKDWSKRWWTLPYRKQEVEVNSNFFEQLEHINIVDVLAFVNAKAGFLDNFTHILNKNIRSTIEPDNVSAVIIAKATNHGIYRMSKISNISLGTLRQYSESYVTLENVIAACNFLADKIKDMAIFNYYDINNVLHGGIDGQKYKTKRDCLKARPSSKYFHFGKGVSSGTLLINHVPANATLFGANEHESRFVFDLVYNNETDIQPEIISTDSAGSNFVNFALLNLIGRVFAPCFKTISSKENMLHSFEKPSVYKDSFIRPKHRVKKQLIIDEWPNIKRIMASLAMKKSAQSVIVRKLCSNAVKNKTKEALWAYDNIIRSHYLLDYINDESLRQSVRTALNRNESFHQLKKAITTINSDDLIGSDDDDIFLNDQCTRLLSLVVIYYNAYLLSEVVKHKERFGTKEELAAFRHMSLVAWIHINFYGHYNFSSTLTEEAVNKMLKDILCDSEFLFK